jgi:hypothetical protein
MDLSGRKTKQRRKQNMADFVEKTVTKTAVRELASPIADETAFTGIVQNVVTNNPFACVPYMQAGLNHQGVEKTKEQYTVRIVYEDTNGKTLGDVTARVNSVAGFNAVAALVLADTELTAAIGGTPHRDVENESYATTLKCHDQNGELYNVVFGRESVRLNSYSDDAIRNRVETWADGVPSLG